MHSSLTKMLISSLRWQVAPSSGAAAAVLGTRGFGKATTGIVGLPVDENARHNLEKKLKEVLDAVKPIPADAEYRRSVEATVNAKLKALSSEASDEALEEQFGRQLEQEIKLCKDELRLIPQMLQWRPWEKRTE